MIQTLGTNKDVRKELGSDPPLKKFPVVSRGNQKTLVSSAPTFKVLNLRRSAPKVLDGLIPPNRSVDGSANSHARAQSSEILSVDSPLTSRTFGAVLRRVALLNPLTTLSCG